LFVAPGNFFAMRAEVIEGATRPGHGKAKAFFSAGARGGILSALVKTHHNVGAESDLDVDGVLGCKEVRTSVEVGAELDAIVSDFAERAEREDLKAAGVREDGARPTDEAMQAAHAANGLVAGTQIEMVGVAEDDFCAEGFERVLGNGFDGSLRADGHEDGGFNGLMGQEETAAAAAGGGFSQNLELQAHQRILSVRLG
jgi:hypothetical protein